MGSPDWHVDIFDFHNNIGWQPLVSVLEKLNIDHTFHDATFNPEVLKRLQTMREADGNMKVPRVYILHRRRPETDDMEVLPPIFAPSPVVFNALLTMYHVVGEAGTQTPNERPTRK